MFVYKLAHVPHREPIQLDSAWSKTFGPRPLRPRSLWFSAFVAAKPLLGHSGTRLRLLVCRSGGLPPRRKPTLLRDLRPFVFFPLRSRLQPQHPRPILDPAQQPTPCRFGACPRSATLVHDFSSARPRPVLHFAASGLGQSGARPVQRSAARDTLLLACFVCCSSSL